MKLSISNVGANRSHFHRQPMNGLCTDVERLSRNIQQGRESKHPFSHKSQLIQVEKHRQTTPDVYRDSLSELNFFPAEIYIQKGKSKTTDITESGCR